MSRIPRFLGAWVVVCASAVFCAAGQSAGELSREAGAFVSIDAPVVAVYEISIPGRPPLEERTLAALAPAAREEYLTRRNEIARQTESITGELFPRAQAFEYAFFKAGGLLAAGVDPTGNGGALPGFGDQRNYELLLEAEFTPAEAIQIMTLNGARVLGVEEELGSVEVGKIADLVVIQGDPVARPAEIRNVVTVFKDGVGYDSKKLVDSVEGLVGVK